MLNIMRKRAQSTLIQAVVLIIAIVFIFWGVGTNLGSKRNTLATVNDVEIPYQDYQRNYDNAVENMRVQFGGSIPPGFLEGLGLNRQVMNQLVQAEILRQGGNEMGLEVSKLATQDEIKKMEVFQVNGQFDLNLYKSILVQNRMTPTGFEADLQKDLLSRRVSEAISDFGVVTDDRIQASFDYANQEAKLAYLSISSKDLEDAVEVTEEKLAEWYKENSGKYKGEPKVRLQYLAFAFDEDLETVSVSEEAIAARYQAEQGRYFTPEQRRARHILLKTSESDDFQVRAEKREKAEEVLRLAREGQDFAELAKQYSEGPSGPQGGDLGFFSQGAMVESFDAAVFAMQPGEISEIVETVFGYHVIKLEETRPAATRPLEEVKDELVAEMKQQEVKGVTFRRATQAYENIMRSGSLEKFRQNSEHDVRQTEYFSQSEPPDGPVADPAFLAKAFSLQQGELSSLVETGFGYAIIYVEDIEEPTVPELATVRERVVGDYRKARSRVLAREKADTILAAAREKGELAAAAPEGAEVKESDYVPRSNPLAQADLPAQVVQGAFNLTAKEPFPEEPAAVENGFVVYQLLETRTSEESLDDTMREQLRTQLLASVQGELLNSWLAWMQGKTEVWINEQILQ